MSPAPSSAPARVTFSGGRVRVDVRQTSLRDHSHIVIVIEPDVQGGQGRTLEYVTDDTEVEEAVRTGLEIASSFIACHRP
jgi:hypothetical protein